MNPFEAAFYQSVASIPFIAATGSPLFAVMAVFAFTRKMHLAWRAALLILVNALSFPIGFILVMSSLGIFPNSGANPGVGVATVPMLLVWMATAVGTLCVLIALAVLKMSNR